MSSRYKLGALGSKSYTPAEGERWRSVSTTQTRTRNRGLSSKTCIARCRGADRSPAKRPYAMCRVA
ncbi:hypothetical protein DICSQDRAFT_133062 [Dichomitus squalens LYAD-421 SS1]|uniref:uncharacterized protein n=1 Tax=Dichomitus squalens (strain LYAD-421) TaxID=732165 RepID=UPI0004413DEE|nr:uncharacterized protein DICSQDRAFT_133062 [Dichomitus squalens LYAD-421 SS1]EJF65439.1 hypothetical protein DICSQDRAFT_133062 [Dichomitus squalens LYAD-421 SS1]